MCLIVLAHQLNADYPLILAANRDEFRQRPTQKMHWWPDIQILAGKDLKADGTWLALHKNGCWAAVTNFRKAIVNQDSSSNTDIFKTRGRLVVDFLSQNKTALAFAEQLQMPQFAGFNLLLWDNHKLVFCGNQASNSPQVLGPGLYGLSNGQLDSNWPKVNRVKNSLQQSVQAAPEHQKLQAMMQDTSIAQDQRLPTTGLTLAWERRLSACFIDAPEYAYGTRTCISVLRHSSGMTDVQETCFDHFPYPVQHFNWTCESSCTPA